MPTAKLSDIVRRYPPIRRITGSADIPLTSRGREQAGELAMKGPFHRINTSPRQRAQETAETAGAGARVDPSLDAWRLGQHEGKPAEMERAAVNQRVTSRPITPTGTSAYSGETGESFEQFRRRYIQGAQKRRQQLMAGEKVLNVTHGRNLRLHESWLKNGAPENGKIDKSHMTGDGEWSKPGQLFRENTETNSLDPVEHADLPGNYYTRHGETEWNQQPKTN